MKILIFECWHQSPQYETGLELAEIHAEKNDQVIYVNIGRYLPFLEWHDYIINSTKGKLARFFVENKKFKKTKNIINSNIDFRTNTLLRSNERKKLYEVFSFENVTQLKAYEWQSIDIGMAAASSLISVTNNLEPDTKVKYARDVNDIIYSAKISAESFKRWLDQEKPDLVYFRNGRVAVYRSIYRICQQREQKFLIHDRGCNKYHYAISPDLRHNFDMVHNEVIEAWMKNNDEREKREIASEYYNDRRKGMEQDWKTYLEKQKKATLPNKWDEKKHNIVFYNSSISEYAAITDKKDPNQLFDSQIEAIYFIADLVEKMDDTEFYVRLHPNLINQGDYEKRLWYNINHQHIKLIYPESEVDTYALMDNADLIITLMSMTGIEAAYTGKPVIQLSKSWYYRLGSTYYPQGKNDLAQMVMNKSIKPKCNKGAIMYGYYRNIFGNTYKYYKPINLHKGFFKGKDLQQMPTIIKYYKLIKKLFR